MNNTLATVDCPHCQGNKTVAQAVQWSDGLGSAVVDCLHCEMKGWVYADAHVEAMRQQILTLKNEKVSTETALRSLKEDTMRYLDSSEGRPFVRGLPGSSMNVKVWRKRLEGVLAPHRDTLEARIRAEQTSEHGYSHMKAVHPTSAEGCARTYCAHCTGA